MSKRVIDAEFESKEAAEGFRNYIGGELKERKHLRDTDKKRRPSTVSEPKANEYRKANGTIEIYVKDVSEFEKDANTAIRNKLRSEGWDGYLPWVPLKNSVAELMEEGNSKLKEYKGFLKKNGIKDAKLDESFGKFSKLVIPVKELDQNALKSVYTGIESYAETYGKIKFSTPYDARVLWRTSSGTLNAEISILGVRRNVKYDGEVYKTDYTVKAGVRGWRGAVKSLYTDAGTKAKELGSTKFEVRKMK